VGAVSRVSDSDAAALLESVIVPGAAQLKCKAGRIELQILHCNIQPSVDAAPRRR
jgi:hypothetical protein